MLEISLTSVNDSGESGTSDCLRFNNDTNAADSAASFFDTLVRDLPNSPLSEISLRSSETPEGVLLRLLSKVKETDASRLLLSGFETTTCQEFIDAFELLAGSGLEHLVLTESDFSDDQLVSLFKSFEIAAISCLSLGDIKLTRRTPEALAKIFGSLSDSNIQLLEILADDKFSSQQLKSIFNVLKEGGISSLHLVTTARSQSVFSALEQSVFSTLKGSKVRSLKLSSDCLNGVNLEALFSDLSDSGITTLDFSSYDLSDTDKRKKFVEAIGKTGLKGVKTVVLRDTNVHRLSGQDLSTFFDSFKNTTIGDLDLGVSLSNNTIDCTNLNWGLSGLMQVPDLHSLHLRITGSEKSSLKLAFTWLNVETFITHLDLSGSSLEDFSSEALIGALKNSSVCSLDLSRCSIDCSKESLIKLFKSLANTNIKHFIFHNNQLGLFELADLTAILKSVPSDIQIDISHNNLFHRKRSMAERDSLLKTLATMKKPIYSHNGESDFARAVVSIPALRKGETFLPQRIMNKILFFIAPRPNMANTLEKIERNLLMNKNAKINSL